MTLRFDLTPDHVRAWRKGLGLTQAQAAEIYGVHHRTWVKWEGGERPIPGALGDVMRLHRVYRDELAALRLSYSEACLVMDALGGYLPPDPGAYRTWWVEVHDHIEINGADERWRVNGRHLLARLRALGPGGAMAVVDAATRFWQRCGDEPTDEVLRSLGLTAGEPPPDLPGWMREGPPIAGDEWKEDR